MDSVRVWLAWEGEGVASMHYFHWIVWSGLAL